MKKQTKVLFTFLGLLAFAGCQKENQAEPSPATTVATVQTTSYSVNGEELTLYIIDLQQQIEELKTTR